MIHTSYEHRRGCGYRQPGGLYLVAGAMAKVCGKLPIPLTVCPCCSVGIKPSRGWTWISHELVNVNPCTDPECRKCEPFYNFPDPDIRMGMIWIGEKFYKTPADFSREGLGDAGPQKDHLLSGQ